MRVIAGTAKGRRLKAPPGRGTRPTPERVREALFSSVAAEVIGAVVLDLYAGTGALGIEALSRGAVEATFVEHDHRTVDVLRHNLDAAGVADRARVVRADAASFVRRPQGPACSLVLCDPPYDVPLDRVMEMVGVLQAAGGLTAAATVVIERDRRDPALQQTPATWEDGFSLAVHRQRSYGDTVLLYLTTKEP